ncbi:hypothetical protein DPMN_177035 [Dreissena polymorpha]|uniref:Uncharacterized protein n=1 Tax=Dreissena polymorpha TaxID=45954 RepID=A0A9D4EAH8_DREPO|nr:hypothetical protein DPMN_177035 [Dreissena polymorpha]
MEDRTRDLPVPNQADTLPPYYRPHESDMESLTELDKSLALGRCSTSPVYDKFLEVIEEFSLTQMVSERCYSKNPPARSNVFREHQFYCFDTNLRSGVLPKFSRNLEFTERSFAGKVGDHNEYLGTYFDDFY